VAADPKLSRDFDKAFAEALGVKRKLFCPPLKLVTDKATRGKEIKWGYTKVMVKDKLGTVHFTTTVANACVGNALLGAYSQAVKLYKKQQKLEIQNACK